MAEDENVQFGVRDMPGPLRKIEGIVPYTVQVGHVNGPCAAAPIRVDSNDTLAAFRAPPNGPAACSAAPSRFSGLCT